MILSEPGPIPQAPVGQFCRHNLSPRGDGNFWAWPKLPAWAMTQLIPARGRKQSKKQTYNHLLADTTYPREGTETAAHRAVKPCAATQLIPARGRKRIHLIRQIRIPDTTYPREGTETYSTSRHRGPWRDTTYPREGTETLNLDEFGEKHTDTTYPREGTETLRRKQRNLSVWTQLIPARGRKLTSALLFCLCCRT